jgi:hypothetical protein
MLLAVWMSPRRLALRLSPLVRNTCTCARQPLSPAPAPLNVAASRNLFSVVSPIFTPPWVLRQ